MLAERGHRTVRLLPRIPGGPIIRPDLPDRPTPEPDDEPGTDTPSARRRYSIVAERFRCGDESGVDWWGSDEVRWSFTTKLDDENSTTSVSRKFGDVDSGNEFAFGAGQGEIAPPDGSLADSVAAPVGVSIQLVEEDFGEDLKKEVEETFKLLEQVPKVGEWVSKAPQFVRDFLVKVLENDLMGSNTITFRARDLERRLPTIGSSFVDRFYFGGQGGDLPFAVAGGPDYYLYIRVTRQADA